MTDNRIFPISGIVCFVLFPLILNASSSVAYSISYTESVKKTYFTILDLKMDRADVLLEELEQQQGNNLAILHLKNLQDFLTIFISEKKQLYKTGLRDYDHRISILNEHTVSGPYHDYIRAEIHMQWGILHLKFGNFYKAFNAIKKAYHIYENNRARYPNFLPNIKSLGILHAVIGTIPSEYRWGVKLLSGMEGDLGQGQKEIEYVLENSNPENFLFYRETLAMYILLQLHLKNNPDRAWKLLQSASLKPGKEPLSCFAYANLAMRTGRNKLAIQYLENRPRGEEFMDFYYLDFMLGIAYLRKQDKRAIEHLTRFVKNYPGENYLKEAYQKIGWYAVLSGDKKAYFQAMESVLTHGRTLIDEDKSAQREAELGEYPEKELLKARLLFDGGYYRKSYQHLLSHSNELYQSEEHSLEYVYRLGRAGHEMNNLNEAVAYYKQTYEEGKNSPQYYACSAALQLGFIAENKHNFTVAKKWYDRCLNLSPETYKSGLHQKAKTGLERLESMGL